MSWWTVFTQEHMANLLSRARPIEFAPGCKLNGPSPRQQICHMLLCFNGPPGHSRQPPPVWLSLRWRRDTENGRHPKDGKAEHDFKRYAVAEPIDLSHALQRRGAQPWQCNETVEIRQDEHDDDDPDLGEQRIAVGGVEKLVERAGDAEARIGDAACDNQSYRHHRHQGIAQQYIDAPLACFMRAKQALLHERKEQWRQSAYPGGRG